MSTSKGLQAFTIRDRQTSDREENQAIAIIRRQPRVRNRAVKNGGIVFHRASRSSSQPPADDVHEDAFFDSMRASSDNEESARGVRPALRPRLRGPLEPDPDYTGGGKPSA